MLRDRRTTAPICVRTRCSNKRMRIYVDKKGGCYVYGSVSELQSVATSVSRFIEEKGTSMCIPTDSSGSPAPFTSALDGLEFEKGDGPLLVTIEDRRKLRIKGAKKHLATYASQFLFGGAASPGDHHHPELDYPPEYISAESVPVVIEIE